MAGMAATKKPRRTRSARTRKPPPSAGKPRRELTEAERNVTEMELAEWAARLSGLAPDEYRDKPPRRPTLVLSRAARLVVYEKRAAAGESLWHEGDLIARNGAAVRIRDGLPASMTK
jgi:hypothetical protein